MKQLLFLIAIFCWGTSKAQKVYEFNTTCQQAYKEITQLKLENGLALIAKAKQQNENNLIPYVLESYVDFFTLFFNEDPAYYKTAKPKFEERINLLKNGPETSPLHRFSLGAMHLHKAAVAIKFSEMWSAGWDFKKAYQYMKDNQKLFPTFAPNQLMFGGLQAVVGTVPKGYKWLTSIFGIKGSLSEGMKTVKAFVNSSDPWARLMNNEASFIYCYLTYYIENKKDEALQFIRDKKLDVVNNHLFTYMAANLSLNNKQTEYGKYIVLGRNKSPEYLQTSVWDFELGYVKLYQLDFADAAKYFENFLNSFKGKFYVKDITLKLSWCYYLMGNMAKAEEVRKSVIKRGATDTDADKKAQKDAKSGVWPNPLLLKARLQNDGGYNNEALQLLAGKTIEGFEKIEDKLEFAYRVARINDDLNKYAEAIKYYEMSINLGKNRTEHYAPRAALQTAMIYEKLNKKAIAIGYYQQCIDMEGHDYKNSLDQRAKAGIARCKGE